MGVGVGLARAIARCGLLVGIPAAHAAPDPVVARARLHPLHTTITTVTYDARSRYATATVRIFVSDLATAIARRRGTVRAAEAGPPSDADSFAYIAGAFTVVGRDSRPAVLEPCGARVTGGDLMWLCVRMAFPEGLAGVRVGNSALEELFDDQVNVVMIDHDGHRDSLLFTKGDGPKPVS
jgi:hypothetical protein